MNWKEYEDAVFEALRIAYPGAIIRRNIKVPSRSSGANRQIDILVEYYLLGKLVRIIVDTKLYSQLIDVKDIDSFIGMADDVDAVEGILVTDKGYTQAAINRAYNASVAITLETYSLAELKDTQSFRAVVHSGVVGVEFSAPFGWLIDATERQSRLATLYQHGKTVEQAEVLGEFIYVNIFRKTSQVNSIEELISYQGRYLNKYSKTISQDAIPRPDSHPTLLRKAVLLAYPQTLEYTGFVDFGVFIFFCVLFTPLALQVKNVRKVQFILERAEERDMSDFFSQAIDDLEASLSAIQDTGELAYALFMQGKLLRQINRYDEANSKLDSAVTMDAELLVSSIIEKTIMGIAKNDNNEQLEILLNNWFESSPNSGQVVYDIMMTLESYGVQEVGVSFLTKKLRKYKKSEQELGLMHYQMACAYAQTHQNSRAKKSFGKARNELIKVTTDDDPIIQAIDQMLAVLT